MDLYMRPRFVIEPRQGTTTTGTGTPTTTGTATTTSTSSSGIFQFPSASPSPTTVRPNLPPSKQSVPQLVLEWVFALAAILVLILLLCCRYQIIRRRGLPVSQMFSSDRPRRPNSPNARPFRHSIRHPYNHPSRAEDDGALILPGQPLQRALHSDALFTIPHSTSTGQIPTTRPPRAIHAQDTDAGGRREGVHPDDDVENGGGGGGGDKEMLPAYDGGRDGPPKYYEAGSAFMAPVVTTPPVARMGNNVEHLELGTLRRRDRDSVGSDGPLRTPTSATPLREEGGIAQLPTHEHQDGVQEQHPSSEHNNTNS